MADMKLHRSAAGMSPLDRLTIQGGTPALVLVAITTSPSSLQLHAVTIAVLSVR